MINAAYLDVSNFIITKIPKDSIAAKDSVCLNNIFIFIMLSNKIGGLEKGPFW